MKFISKSAQKIPSTSQIVFDDAYANKIQCNQVTHIRHIHSKY